MLVGFALCFGAKVKRVPGGGVFIALVGVGAVRGDKRKNQMLKGKRGRAWLLLLGLCATSKGCHQVRGRGKGKGGLSVYLYMFEHI